MPSENVIAKTVLVDPEARHHRIDRAIRTFVSEPS